MLEFLFVLIVDLFLTSTGLVLAWSLTLGRFKLIRPERGNAINFLMSLIGLLFWLGAIFVVLFFGKRKVMGLTQTLGSFGAKQAAIVITMGIALAICLFLLMGLTAVP